MKKFFNVIVLMLAVNFLTAAGGVGWLYQSGHLDKQRRLGDQGDGLPAAGRRRAPPATQPSAGDESSQPASATAGLGRFARSADEIPGGRPATAGGAERV